MCLTDLLSRLLVRVFHLLLLALLLEGLADQTRHLTLSARLLSANQKPARGRVTGEQDGNKDDYVCNVY